MGAAVLAGLIVAILLVWQLALGLARLGLRVAPQLPGRVAAWQLGARVGPLRSWLADRFPGPYAWAARRLAPRRFAGLPLTLMAVAAAYLVFLLTGLAEDVVEAEEIVQLDDAVSALFTEYRRTFLVSIFAWITDLGGKPALVAASFVATGFLWADRRPLYILPLWVTIVGALGTTWIGKFGFARGRPEFITEVTALSPAFPSAHATGALAVYGFVAYAIARDTRTPRQRFEVVFWTCILIALIGFSRIFLSVHFASDVAAGFLVGAFWLIVGFALTEYRRQSRPVPEG